MAASKRRPDKSKRYQQNKAKRQARAARSARAGEATAISRGDRAAASSASEPGAQGATKGKRARPRRESPWKLPGQRAVVLAFLFTLVSAATLLFAPIQVERDVPPDDPRVEAEDPELNDDGTVTILEDGKLIEEESAPVAGMVIGAPVLITGIAVLFTKRPQRSTVWTMCLLAFAAYIFLFSGPYGVISLPSLIALAVGNFQSRRAENKVRMEQMRQDRAARQADAEATGGTVIDVDSVEDVDDSDAETTDERSS